MLKKIFFLFGLVLIGLVIFIGLLGYLDTKDLKAVEALTQPLQTELEVEALTSSKDILAFLDGASCPPISPYSEKELSKHLLINKFKEQKLSPSATESLEKKATKKFPQLDFSNLPIFVYQDTLYLAQINYDNQADLDTLRTVSPKLANKIISCYFSDRKIPLLNNFYLKTFTEDSAQRTAQLKAEIVDIKQRLQATNISEDLKASLNSSLHVRETQLKNLEYQVGYFNPPNAITLIMSDKHNFWPDRYLATLIHEHMHFVSFTPNQKLERFFFDGLADYFTDEALKSIGREYQISYALPVELIKDMLQDIPQSKFEEVMFSNDQVALESLIDQTYGKNFYDNHRQLFLTAVDNIKTETIAQEAYEKIKTDLQAAKK